MEIGSNVLEKKNFEGFFNMYGHNGHLGHVTSIMSCNSNFLVAYIQNLVQNGPLVSEKKQF